MEAQTYSIDPKITPTPSPLTLNKNFTHFWTLFRVLLDMNEYHNALGEHSKGPSSTLCAKC